MAEANVEQAAEQALAPLRREIEALDDSLIELLDRRFDIIRRVAAIKSARGLPAVLPERIAAVRDRAVAQGGARGLDEAMLHRLWTILIDEACALEDRLMAEGESPSD